MSNYDILVQLFEQELELLDDFDDFGLWCLIFPPYPFVDSKRLVRELKHMWE